MTLIVASIGIIVATFLFVAPIPQDPAYHLFVDQRSALGISNIWNVLSNLPFLLVGGTGLIFVRRDASTVCPLALLPAYVIFFVGILLTAFGSAYYHLAPSNDTLVWDRLPMTIGFAGLFSIIVGEFVSVRIARRLLLPLLAAGVFSVAYWAYTEASGNGDLRPYAIVQFLPMLLIPVILLTSRSKNLPSSVFWLMFVFYFVAKLFEYFDAGVFAAGNIVSGHSLKHVAASLTPATFLYALVARRGTMRRTVRSVR